MFGLFKKKSDWQTVRMYSTVMYNGYYAEVAMRVYEFQKLGDQRRVNIVDIPKHNAFFNSVTKRLDAIVTMWTEGYGVDFDLVDETFRRIESFEEARDLYDEALVKFDEKEWVSEGEQNKTVA